MLPLQLCSDFYLGPLLSVVNCVLVAAYFAWMYIFLDMVTPLFLSAWHKHNGIIH